MTSESPSAKNAITNVKQPIPRTLEFSAPPNVAVPESPAAQHLAALNKKEVKKEGKSSRLRRAFSFGSAAELRKASAENSHQNNVSVERTKLRKDRYQDEQNAEQAAIAQKQEAAGLGEGIYSGQGHFFTGSTDNLSISSTASSASIMIRKMGKGMKKSSRSLVGLFRPKSVIGVPAADATVPEPSVAQVSMVTVEAEREKVNVNIDPHDHEGGGTGFPKLGRNSIDAASLATKEPSLSLSERSSGDHALPRRSIVGSEKERAEVLAAVKKGILKRMLTGACVVFILQVADHMQGVVPILGVLLQSIDPLIPRTPSLFFPNCHGSIVPLARAPRVPQMTNRTAPAIDALTRLPLKAKTTLCHSQGMPTESQRACLELPLVVVTSASVLGFNFMIPGPVENTTVGGKSQPVID